MASLKAWHQEMFQAVLLVLQSWKLVNVAMHACRRGMQGGTASWPPHTI